MKKFIYYTAKSLGLFNIRIFRHMAGGTWYKQEMSGELPGCYGHWWTQDPLPPHRYYYTSETEIYNNNIMKKLFITAILSTALFTAQAQTQPVQQPKETPVSITITPSQINAIQQIFAFLYQWLPKSDAPARDVQLAMQTIQQLYQVVQMPADTTKKKPVPAVQKGGKKNGN